MAVRAAKSLLHQRRPIAYRRILVPLAAETEPEHALAVARRLAAEHRGSITAVTVIELPVQLPLDAHMHEEEAEARRLFALADRVAGRYGVKVVARVLRARDAAPAVVEEAARSDAVPLGPGPPA